MTAKEYNAKKQGVTVEQIDRILRNQPYLEVYQAAEKAAWIWKYLKRGPDPYPETQDK